MRRSTSTRRSCAPRRPRQASPTARRWTLTPRPSTAGCPRSRLPCLGGGRDVDLAGLTGEPTVLNFWAQTCGPCRQESPLFQQLHETGDVRVLGVDFYDPIPGKALAFADELGLTYPQIADPEAATRAPMRVQGLPMTVFVDEDGKVDPRGVRRRAVGRRPRQTGQDLSRRRRGTGVTPAVPSAPDDRAVPGVAGAGRRCGLDGARAPALAVPAAGGTPTRARPRCSCCSATAPESPTCC